MATHEPNSPVPSNQGAEIPIVAEASVIDGVDRGSGYQSGKNLTRRGWMLGDRHCGCFPMLASSSAPDFMDQPIKPGRRDSSNNVELGSSIRVTASRVAGEIGAQ
jgi:hypothetical protein